MGQNGTRLVGSRRVSVGLVGLYLPTALGGRQGGAGPGAHGWQGNTSVREGERESVRVCPVRRGWSAVAAARGREGE